MFHIKAFTLYVIYPRYNSSGIENGLKKSFNIEIDNIFYNLNILGQMPDQGVPNL